MSEPLAGAAGAAAAGASDPGAHASAPTLPLAGVRVVSIATNLPGPAAAARLVTLGASVTKVEPPGGDLLAAAAPEYYRELSVGQKVIRADLKSPDGLATVQSLLGEADLFLTSHRLSALKRLGMSWQEVHASFPHLSQVAIVGHDATDLPGHDLTFQAEAGTLRGEQMPLTLAADLAGAERAAQVACALLLGARRTGVGGFAQISLAGVSESLAAPVRHGLTGAAGMLGGAAPQYRIYPAASGHVAVAAVEPHFWETLTAQLELTGSDDERGAQLRDVLLTRTAREWENWARERGLPMAALREDPPSQA